VNRKFNDLYVYHMEWFRNGGSLISEIVKAKENSESFTVLGGCCLFKKNILKTQIGKKIVVERRLPVCVLLSRDDDKARKLLSSHFEREKKNLLRKIKMIDNKIDKINMSPVQEIDHREEKPCYDIYVGENTVSGKHPCSVHVQHRNARLTMDVNLSADGIEFLSSQESGTNEICNSRSEFEQKCPGILDDVFKAIKEGRTNLDAGFC